MTLKGAAAKGPFILGTNVSIAPVDASGNTTGQQFTTQTSDNAGDFSVSFSYTGPVMLSASGYYYNEVAGALSTSTLTLNGMAGITASGSQNAYINMLSHIAFGRIKSLMAGGASLSSAVSQADSELYAQLDVGGPSFSPGADDTQLNLLGGNTPQAAYVFAASSVVEEAAALSNVAGGTDAKVQSMINTLGADFAASGTFTSSDKSSLQPGIACVEPDGVMASLQARFTAIGSSAVVPDINMALDTDGDGVVNASDTCVLIANATQSMVPNGICNYQYATVPAAMASGQCNLGFDTSTGAGTLVGDVDGQNGADMITGVCTDAFLWLNDGNGTFASPTPLGLPATLGVTGSNQLVASLATLVDMNHDGRLDLFLQYTINSGGQPSQPPQLVYLPGDGAGHFGSAVTVYTQPVCGGNKAPCTSNGQCCSDQCMMMPLPDGGTAGYCNPGGTFTGYSYAVVTDLNGDSVPDVAALSPPSGGPPALTTLVSTGTTGWGLGSTVSLPVGNYQLEGIAAGNLRSSTQVDLAIAANGAGVYLLAGDGSGSYPAPTTAWTGFGVNVVNFGIADLDTDGHPDLIGTSHTTTYSLQIEWGDGTLSPAGAPYTVDLTPAPSPCWSGSCMGQCSAPFAVGDATGDGRPDLSVGSFPDVVVNTGNRTFAAPVLLWRPGNFGPMAGGANLLTDVNGDGRADLVMGSGAPTVILVDEPNHFSW